MLKGFFLSGVLRGYAIVAGFCMQLLLSTVITKSVFGEINAFISSIMLISFIVTAAPTRHLVRELGAFGLSERQQLANSYINNSHVLIVVAVCIAALSRHAAFAILAITISASISASIYSAYLRGIGRYVVGNLEVGVIRSTVLITFLAIAFLLGGGVTLPTAQLLYLAASTIGLLFLVCTRGVWPSIGFSRQNLTTYGKFPLTLTLLAGLETFSVNFDVILTTYLYSPDITAEVRVAQQLRSLTLLPIQIYLMFSYDRLSRSLRNRVDTEDRRKEINLVRLFLVGTFLLAMIIARPFSTLFFEGGSDFLTTLAVLSGVVPIVLLGPKAEMVIAASREQGQMVKTTTFLLVYIFVIPFLCWVFGLPPYIYFFAQAALSAVFYVSLPKLM